MPGARRLAAAGLLAVVALTGCGKPDAKVTAATSVQKGLGAHMSGRLDDALKEYEKALKAEPNNTLALYNIGLVHQTRGNAAEAEAKYRAVIALDPKFSAALFNLAILRNNAGAPLEAIDLYYKVLDINPQEATAHLNVGFALKSIGKHKEGDRELAYAVRLDPSLASRVPSASPSPSPSDD